MSNPRYDYEYQVSESARADRKYFNRFSDALLAAREMSHKQAYPVYIDVYSEDAGELCDFWYTVTKGKLVKHGGSRQKVTQ